MRDNYDIDPDLRWLGRLDLDTTRPWKLRAANAGLRALWRVSSVTREVPRTPYTIAGPRGPLRIDVLRPAEATDEVLPALVYLHGGGFYLEGTPAHQALCQHYAKHARCAVLYVHYTLALTAPYPAALDDAHAAFLWAQQAPGVDASRLVVGGDSAGGALAASLCLRLRDDREPAPAGQMLMWPATDDAMQTASMQQLTDTPLWDRGKTERMWRYYLGHIAPEARTALMAPARAASLDDLPPAYIETAEFDPLRDEGLAWARRLAASGVPVELNETKRTIHAYDLAYTHPLTQEALARRVRFLRRTFGTAP